MFKIYVTIVIFKRFQTAHSEQKMLLDCGNMKELSKQDI